MANIPWRIRILKKYLIPMKIDTRRFLRSLRIDTQNSKIEYCQPKCKNLLRRNENYYSALFEDADCASLLEISKFKMV